MRKIVGLIAIFLAFFLCVHGVISYTNATLENQAVLNITDPVNGLVSLVPIDDPLFIRQGEDKEALYVANNLDTPISYVLEYQHDYLSMKQPDNGFLYPGGNILHYPQRCRQLSHRRYYPASHPAGRF